MHLDDLRARKANKRDIPFIKSSWLNSFREYGQWNRGVPNSIYFYHHQQLLDRILSRSEKMIAHAVDRNSDDEDTIVGYIVYEVGVKSIIIHFAYVKALQIAGVKSRRRGIFKSMVKLLEEAYSPDNWFYTHKTLPLRGGKDPGFLLPMAKRMHAVYCPYFAFHKPDNWEEVTPHRGKKKQKELDKLNKDVENGT